MASEIDDRIKQPTTRENVLFYVTAFFCLVAVFSVFIFLFLVPFFIEPALATIYMEFDPEPVVCQTTEATFHRGLSNCPWSSCREGCTKEVYECWHIRVRYRSNVPVGLADSRSVRDRIAQHKTPSSTPPAPLKQNVNYKSVHHAAGSRRDTPTDVDRIQSVLPDDTEPADDEDEDLDSGDDAAFALSDEGGDGLHVHEARLQPNVKGCGYPPDVECNNTFAPAYGVVGANFSCFYSLVDPTLAITQLNIDKVHSDLIYCLTVPIICFLISVVYLLYAYFKLYADDPNGPGTISQGVSGALVSGIPEFDADGNLIVADRPVNSPSRLAGKYGILFQAHPSPDGKRPSSRVVRRARSGGAITMPVRAAHFETRAVAREAMIPFDGTRVPRPKPTDADRGGMRISKSMG